MTEGKSPWYSGKTYEDTVALTELFKPHGDGFRYGKIDVIYTDGTVSEPIDLDQIVKQYGSGKGTQIETDFAKNRIIINQTSLTLRDLNVSQESKENMINRLQLSVRYALTQ